MIGGADAPPRAVQHPHSADYYAPDAVRPDGVFGTPTYMIGERVISLGNPALQTLLELLDAEANRAATAATRVSWLIAGLVLINALPGPSVT